MTEIITKTIEVLESSGTIIYPTDTIWGIGCDATNFEAVSNVYSIKKRAESKSMLILVNSQEMLNKYVKSVPNIAYELINVIQGPLTIVYPNGKNLAKNLFAPDGSIGIRISKSDFCNELIETFNKPIVSTSANIAGIKNPLGFFDIANEIKEAVDYIVPLNLEQLSPRRSSDIIKVKMSGEIEIIR